MQTHLYACQNQRFAGTGSLINFISRLLRLAASILVLVATIPVAQGQFLPGSNDQTFNTADVTARPDGINGSVQCVMQQNDGKLLVGGTFTSINGTSCNRIARLNPDGSLDPSFDPGSGFDKEVHAIAIQPDGKILVGGWFTAFDRFTRSGIVRLNSDGSLDYTFSSGTLSIGWIRAVMDIVLQPDGKILVAGQFTNRSGAIQSSMGRLHPDGSVDITFKLGTIVAVEIKSIALQQDGKVVVGGSYIYRLNADGTRDTSFSSGKGVDFGTVYSIVLQSDGKIIAGGNFTRYDGTISCRLIRLNTNGSLDATFNLGTGFDNAVHSIAVLSDDKLVVGGYFTAYNEVKIRRIACLNADGALNHSFNPGTGYDGLIKAIILQSDGKLIVGGGYTTYNGGYHSALTRIDTDGTLDQSFQPSTGFNSPVSAIALQSDGKLVVGGRFSAFNGTARIRLARLNADGTLDDSFKSEIDFNTEISCMAIQSDGKIIVGEDYTTYHGTGRNRLVRLNQDGSLDHSFNAGTGFDKKVYAIVVQPDGKVVVGGAFTSFNGTAHKYFVRLNANGTLDASFDSEFTFNGPVYTIVQQADSKLIVGGRFIQHKLTDIYLIARLHGNGLLDYSFRPELNFDASVRAVAVQPDGKVLAGGNFTTCNGVARNGITRLHTDGTLDTSFNPDTGSNNNVTAIGSQPNGQLVVSGSFTTFNGMNRNYIAFLRNDGSEDTVFNTETGLDKAIASIVVQPDGKAVIGGDLTTFDGTVRNGIARLHGGDGNLLRTAREQQAGTNILIYPNPARGDINLEFIGAAAMVAGAKLILYDPMGRLVLAREITAAEAQAGIKLATTGLAGGVYFLGINTRNGIIAKRVVLTE